MTIEYRVKRVERFIVTRHEDTGTTVATRQIGKEFDHFETAFEVATALARAEQERLGLPPGDGGVIFPNAENDFARGLVYRPLETYRTASDDATFRRIEAMCDQMKSTAMSSAEQCVDLLTPENRQMFRSLLDEADAKAAAYRASVPEV